MPLTIKGVRLDAVHLERSEGGAVGLKYATYSLISSADTVLADQTIGGGYGNDKVKVNASLATMKALQEFISAYKADINTTLGFTED